MKKNLFLLFTIFCLTAAIAQQPVIVTDCTVTYSITGNDAATNTNLAGASKMVYVKGKMSRIDLIGQNYKQSVIYDNQTGTAIVLKEIGGEKYISKLSRDECKGENKRYEGLSLALTTQTKMILGYECKKAIAKLKDGTVYSIYYTTAITPSASENPYQFKDVPGFVFEYETTGSNGASKITYTATLINLNPVPASRFEIPAAGYRILK